MTDESADLTAVNSGKKATGKPFTKGDPRINRNGRPKNLNDFRKLCQSKMDEPALDANGNPITKTVNGKEHIMTNAEMFVEGWMKSKDRKSFAEYTYGKVKEEVELTGKDGEPLIPETNVDQIAQRVEQLLKLAQLRKENKEDAG